MKPPRSERRAAFTPARARCRFRSGLAVLAASLLAATGCTTKTSEAGFVERSKESGIEFAHTDGSSGRYLIVETLASGVALFDHDGDGQLDIYLLNGRGLPPLEPGSHRNALYRNLGKGRFEDITEKSGVPGVGFSIGACVGDYDQDGDLDLYVAGYGPNVLYRNDGERFTDVTAKAGVDDPRFSAGCAFLDIDQDGDLDLYVSNYCEPKIETAKPCTTRSHPRYCAPGDYTPVTDSLFRNDGDGTFTNVSVSSGIASAAKWGMGVLTLDHDGDGRTDIYVANDVSDNFLWHNLGEGRFENRAIELGIGLSGHGDEQGSMGVDAADFNADGRIDILVTNYQNQLNALYQNEGRVFVDRGTAVGLGDTCLPMVSWGTRFFDVDLDGDLDLFIANGHLEDRIDAYDQSSTYLQQNQLFENVAAPGSTPQYREISNSAGPGLKEALSSRGAAFGDIDNDGDIDIIVVNSRTRPSLLVNEMPRRGHWIGLSLRGKRDRFALGARVTVEAGARRWTDEVRSGGSYCSQSDLRLHIGLGAATQVDRVLVEWPGGTRSETGQLPADRYHEIVE